MRVTSVIIAIFLSLPGWGQVAKVTVSGTVKDKKSQTELPYVNAVIKSEANSLFVGGTVTNEKGLFTIAGISPGNYVLELSFVGYAQKQVPLLVGRLSEFLDLGIVDLEESACVSAIINPVGRGFRDSDRGHL